MNVLSVTFDQLNESLAHRIRVFIYFKLKSLTDPK